MTAYINKANKKISDPNDRRISVKEISFCYGERSPLMWTIILDQFLFAVTLDTDNNFYLRQQVQFLNFN